MSIADVLSRVAVLEQLAGASTSPATAPPVAPPAGQSPTPGTSSPTAAPASFADVLAQTTATAALSGLDDSGPDADTLPGEALPTSTPAPDLAGLEQLLLAGAATQQQPALSPTAAVATTAAPAVPAPDEAGTRILTAAESQLGAAEDPPGSNDGPALAAYRSAVAGATPGQPWCADFVSWAAAQAGVPLGDSGQGFASVAQIADWAGATGRLLPPTATPAPGDLILFGDRHVGIVESVSPDGSLTTVEGNYANAVSRVHRSPAEATGYVRL